ncbi:MAG: MFS transporter, partial [Actinomycetota bacterium]|nr:MFS transporter [Actinomycetota bacterium]
GYSPLKAGVAFLPFTFGIVFAAQLASTLASRVDPRWIAGTGGALSVLAMWGYGRLEADSGYWVELFPWIVVQAIGMGLIFVPLTLTAVSRVDKEDSGVGSAVLNTVQQVGGAIGIAVLGTVFANGITERMTEMQAFAGPPGGPEALDMDLAQKVAQAFGTTQTFDVAVWMMVVATVITIVGLSIKHEDLSTDGIPGVPETADA